MRAASHPPHRGSPATTARRAGDTLAVERAVEPALAAPHARVARHPPARRGLEGEGGGEAAQHSFQDLERVHPPYTYATMWTPKP
eukprot:3827195-Prymnesium_polylepis.1